MIEVAEGRECKQTSLSQQSCTEVQHATTKTLQQQDENFENEKTYTIKMRQETRSEHAKMTKLIFVT